MKVLLVEPFFGGSHKYWAEGLAGHTGFDFTFLTLPARWWKWRMYGGAVALSRRLERVKTAPDVVLASSMLDLTTFQSLTRRRLGNIPHLVYFHENQLAYPANDNSGERDRHYCFINYLSALAADGVAFNSKYNRDTFFEGLEPMLRSFPEYRCMDTIEEIRRKSKVIPLGFDFKTTDCSRAVRTSGPPVILWNHRWEYDKNPAEFFEALRIIKRKGIAFRLIVCGENYRSYPEEFDAARTEFGAEMIHFGFAQSRREYIKLLCRSDLAPVTSLQEFFGISVAEAAWAGAIPLLPGRLSYPEIFPPGRFGELYYSEGGLANHLEKMMRHDRPDALRLRLRESLVRYDWSEIRSVYEVWMSGFVKRKTR